MLNRIRNGKYKGWVHERLEWDPSDPEKDEFQKMLHEKGEVVLHCRGRDIYRLNLQLEGTPVSCFLYVFRNYSLTRALKTPYAWKILRISNKLRKLGFQTIEVLAAVRPKYELLNWNSLLIAKEILNVYELPATGNHVYKVHPSIPFSGQITDETASELARFHDSGLFHGDLKSRHILIPGDSDKAAPIVCFVDLEKTRHHRFLPSLLLDMLAARDLVQLLSSLPHGEESPEGDKEKSRFLSLYLDHRNLGNRRSKRIRKAAGLYLDSGALRQGETLLKGLKRKMTGKIVQDSKFKIQD